MLTSELTLPAPTQEADMICRAAGECLKRVPLDRKLRLLGVRVSALAPVSVASSESLPAQQSLLPG